MKILVVGAGGREHAIVCKLLESSKVSRVFWCPGNLAAPIRQRLEIRPMPILDIANLVALVQREKIDITIVGPEAPLVAGISDAFLKHGLAIFGPTQSAARLEGSKVFSKEFFLRHRIPTGRATIFSQLNEALLYAEKQPTPMVIKADGIAAGKGVIICKTYVEAETALRDIMEKKIFGNAGDRVLIEECLSGPEVSVHAITDGVTYRLLASAQDHKRVLDGDRGPNTGGMGTYSPASLLTPELEKRVRLEIFDRTLAGLKADGIPFCGVLYAGLMITPEGPKILEYNCRFGDPETQVILPRLENDLVEVLLAACHGHLDSIDLHWKSDAAVCVVLAAGGYPGTFRKGIVIHGLAKAAQQSGVQIFHAGTTLQGNDVVTAGGRVLGVTALGRTMREAVTQAYAAENLIHFEGKHCRRDIAAQALDS